jgi:hypothetical protein
METPLARDALDRSTRSLTSLTFEALVGNKLVDGFRNVNPLTI